MNGKSNSTDSHAFLFIMPESGDVYRAVKFIVVFCPECGTPATAMMNLTTIDQRGVADALAKRMAYPAQYMAQPLVVWRSDFRDGVQEGVLREVVKEYNKNKPDEEKRLFWVLDMTDENKPLRCYHDPSRLGFYVVLPATAHPRFDWADDFESGFALIRYRWQNGQVV